MKNTIAKSVKMLSDVLHKQQDTMSPKSNGRGHGRLLKLVAANEGLTAKELSLLLELSSPSVTEKLNSLEDQGMIRRERNNKDRRRVYIYLTPEGRMALARREEGERRFQEIFDSCMSQEEQNSFCKMCERMITSVKSKEMDEKNHNENIVDFHNKQTNQKRKMKR